MASSKSKKRIMKFKGFLNRSYSLMSLRYTSWNAGLLKKQIKNFSIDSLHVGCGDILLKGWLNIHYERREEYGKIKEENDALYLNYNLLKTWPFEADSIQYIAGSHFIEHLDLNQGLEFLKESFRVLKKGGVIRLSCPDLNIYAKNYIENNRKFFENKWIKEWCAFKQAVTPGEIFIAKAYDSGGSHKWFYDFDSLRHVLEAVGFQKVTKEGRLSGQVPDLEKIEPSARELETLYVEALKH